LECARFSGAFGARLCLQDQSQWVDGRARLESSVRFSLATRCGWSATHPRSVLAAGNRMAARAVLRGLPDGLEQGRVSMLNQREAFCQLI
jgi:hypothetical protein